MRFTVLPQRSIAIPCECYVDQPVLAIPGPEGRETRDPGADATHRRANLEVFVVGQPPDGALALANIILKEGRETTMMRYATAGLLAVLMFGITNTEALAGGFDGTWKYRLSTNSSSPTCQGFVSGAIGIKDSKFSGIIAHNQDSFRVRGSVGESGKANFKAIGSYDTATFDVNFTENSGSGTWEATGFDCVGTVKLTNKNPRPVLQKPVLQKQAPAQPTAQVANPVRRASPSTSPTTVIEERLKRLDALLKGGLVTEDEAAEKRKEILKNL